MQFCSRPHRDLEEYTLQFVEDIGLCFIFGFRSGSEYWEPDLVERLKDQIAKKYGPPTSKDTEQTNGKKVAPPKTSAPEIQPRKERTSGPSVAPPKTSLPTDEELGLAKRQRSLLRPSRKPKWLEEDEIDALGKEMDATLADYHYHWSPEAGFKGSGNVKAIELKFSEIRFRKNMKISFWLVTSDVCRKKIDDNSGSCILRS